MPTDEYGLLPHERGYFEVLVRRLAASPLNDWDEPIARDVLSRALNARTDLPPVCPVCDLRCTVDPPCTTAHAGMALRWELHLLWLAIKKRFSRG